MPDVVDRLGAALLDASLAAIAITGLVILVMVQCRQPARRRGWARAGLLSTLSLLPLAALNPVPRIDLRGPLRQILPTGLDAPPRHPRPRGEGPDASAFAGGFDHPGRPACHVPELCPPPGPRWMRWVGRGMVMAYGAGASIGLGWMVLGLWGTAWLIRQARPASIASLEHYWSLAFEGQSRRPRLLVSERATRPVLVGILRPVILIPPDLDGPKSLDRLRLSVLHEFAHVEELDHRFGPAATLAQALWFFLPPVWWIRDQMKLDQEFLADRRAVAHFGTSGRYASSLVDLAATRVSDHEEWPAPSSGGEANAVDRGVTSALIQRVQMLLKCPFAIEGQTPLWWRWSTALTLVLATLAASCLTLRGMAGWSSASTPDPQAEVDRSFKVPDLVISQRANDDQPFDLRFRLPDQFVLTFEVLAEPADLPTLEVLGHRLGPSADPDLERDPSRVVYRLWHRVEIRRAGGIETVRVDDRPLAADPRSIKLAPWLTIRPDPGRTARLRDLEVAW